MARLIDVLIPHYHGTEEMMKRLLDSIAMQKGVDVKVKIVNDGDDLILSDELLSAYSFPIEYKIIKHSGVSAARNVLLDMAESEYVTFADDDDYFCDALAFARLAGAEPYDVCNCPFYEEVQDGIRLDEHDGVHVYGKGYRLAFLRENNIRFDERLTVNEDVYFVTLALNMAEVCKYLDQPWYLWCYNPASVTRMTKAWYHEHMADMLDSNAYLLDQLVERGKIEDAVCYALRMVFKVYYSMFTEWPEGLKSATMKRFAEWWDKYHALFEASTEAARLAYSQIEREEAINRGMTMEKYSFPRWLHRFNTTGVKHGHE